jgi:predicted GNAT superfamily acetyltransferase
VIIQPITAVEEIKKIPLVDSAIWRGETVPAHILTAIAANGGALLGAYIDEKLIGFTLGWIGTTESASPPLTAKHLKLVSHMTGVLPEYRDQKVGCHLKLAQREWALARGLELITWTYDPLESRNARLNVRLLGATCQTYLRNVYGEMEDQLNRGIASDRFQVDWRINTKHVQGRLDSEVPLPTLSSASAPLLNPAVPDSDAIPHPPEQWGNPSGERFLVEIPVNMQAIRQADIALGTAWREHTRTIFESAFADGYQVTDFIFERDSSPPRSFYLLEKINEA